MGVDVLLIRVFEIEIPARNETAIVVRVRVFFDPKTRVDYLGV